MGVEVTLGWAGHVLLPRKLAALAKGHKERSIEKEKLIKGLHKASIPFLELISPYTRLHMLHLASLLQGILRLHLRKLKVAFKCHARA